MVVKPDAGWRRNLRMGKLGLDLTASYLGTQVKQLFSSKAMRGARRQANNRRNARLLRKELQELRGPAMKLGQMLSMQTQMVPEEMVTELTALQMQAPPMHPTLMRAQIKAALGRYPEEIFRNFSDEPFAAASLGQVHRACGPDHEPLAVKIQYPAMAEVIRTDFQALRTLALPARISRHLNGSMLAEIQRGILEETDYVREAKNLEYFRRHLGDLAFVRVPAVYWEWTSNQVLTMSFVPGLHLDQFLARKPSQEIRDLVGRRLLELFVRQLFQLRAMQADPHSGNYLFDEDGTIGLVDFGCVKYFKKSTADYFRKVWLNKCEDDRDKYFRLLEPMFERDRMPTGTSARNAMIEMTRFYNRLYPVDPKHADACFDFGDGAFLKEMIQLGNRLLRHRFLAPEFVFLGRAELGLYQMLHRLRAQVPTSKIARASLAVAGLPEGV
ncbi:MAG: hypothetical protein C5B50_15885 [Verrucomicrobia bacterium]|nr:MAG: hypothetical protein C5B50_15885 [Verrucomicrobiota bacterium]